MNLNNINIKIRAPEVQDGVLFIKAMIASQDYHAPWTTAPSTEEQYKDYLLKYSSDNNKSFLILYNDDIAGVVNLNEIVYGAFKSTYLGYYGVKQFAGLGVMQQGMRLVIEHAFSNMGLHRLEANIQPKNIKSINLVKKLGFIKEGFSSKYLYINDQWCDHERWAILNEINFIGLSMDHLSLIHQWFKNPIVNKWYARGENWSIEDIRDKYSSRISNNKDNNVPTFIIHKGIQPIGFIQYYLLTVSLPDGISDYYNDLFKQYNANELSGIDFFLCDEYQNKGFGSIAIEQFIDAVIPRTCRAVIADPLSCNFNAIKALEKIGFDLYRKIIDKNRDEEICLMIKILD